MRFDQSVILQRTLRAIGDVSRADPSASERVAGLARELLALDGPASRLLDVPDWRAAYEADSMDALKACMTAQHALYERVHVIRRETLPHVVGEDWLAEIVGRAAYGWLSGRSDLERAHDDRLARILAWLDHVCVTRNKVVHHRDPSVRLRFVVLPDVIAEVYSPTPRSLGGVVDCLKAARRQFQRPGDTPDSSESVAYVMVIAESVRAFDLPVVDELDRVVRRSGIWVVMGSADFIANLDDALATIVLERFE